MSNKIKYYVIFNKGHYEVKSKDFLTEYDMENVVYSSPNASAACLKADELEEEYIRKNNSVDTRHYFENLKYKSIIPQSLNECKD